MSHAVQSPYEPTAESRYRMLFERAPVGILNSGPEHRCIEANESLCRMLGYSREEIIGMPTAEFVTADVERQGEWRLRRKDGTTFPASIIASGLPDGTLLEMIQDITSLQEREEARRIAEQRLHSEMRFSDSMLESMPGVVYIYDSQRRFRRWNRNFETVSGYSASEIAGMHPLDFFAGEDKALVEQRIAEVFEHGESSVEALFVAKDGTTRPYFFTGRLAQFDSGPCLIGMGIDTFERRRALDTLAQLEREYRELVAAANSIILRWDPAGRITYINDFGQQFFGYRADELVGRHVMDTIVPRAESGGRDLTRLMDDICAEPDNFSQNVNENMRRDGTRVWIAWTNRIVRDAAGRVIELLSIGTDITEQKRAQQLLRESEERARQAQKLEAIGLLASGVAHDFNNLLATILGNTQLALADTVDGHPARESLHEISTASLRARSLVQQILSFARHQPQQRRVIELAPNLEEAHNFLRAILPAAVELVFSMDAATPPVLADATQVYQLIANLCTNAWHAFEGSPGRIEVGLRSVTLDAAAAGSHPGLKPGRFACLSVTDNGKGMDTAVLERIFDPFYTTKEPGAGLGLGMSVVHGIVRSHDGAITVASTPGVGTTIEVYFPATAGNVEVPQAPATAPQRGAGQHILYLDDEGPLVFLATRMLQRLGYRVSGYTRAENALQDYRDSPAQFDLAITDLNMPTLSGIEVATELLRLRPELPVVLCSGHVTEELVQRARSAGICEVLYKPGTIEEFAASIHRIASGVTAPRTG